MTYPLFLLVYLVLPIALLTFLLRARISAGWWRTVVGLAVLAAVLYTAPWDNYLVATGVWSYDPARVWNIVLGYVPLEEYLFFVLQPVLAALITLGLLRKNA
jgi:lycopene cyclase domain-containing protein